MRRYNAGMDKRQKNEGGLVVLIVAACFAVALYATGYLALSQSMTSLAGGGRCRMFPSLWLVTIYQPAAKVESVVIGKRVDAGCLR